MSQIYNLVHVFMCLFVRKVDVLVMYNSAKHTEYSPFYYVVFWLKCGDLTENARMLKCHHIYLWDLQSVYIYSCPMLCWCMVLYSVVLCIWHTHHCASLTTVFYVKLWFVCDQYDNVKSSAGQRQIRLRCHRMRCEGVTFSFVCGCVWSWHFPMMPVRKEQFDKQTHQTRRISMILT